MSALPRWSGWASTWTNPRDQTCWSKLLGQQFSKPRDLLAKVRGIEFIELARPDECCGFGGTFSVFEEGVSAKMSHGKVQDQAQSGAAYVASSDSSCLMHQQGCAGRAGIPVKHIHIAAATSILAAVRAHLPKLDRPEPLADLLAAFGQMLERMGGKLLAPGAGDLVSPVRAMLRDAKVVCSNVPEVAGNRTLALDMAPTDLADVDYGIVRAAFAVAETGSVCLTEAELGVNTLGYLPQHLVVLQNPAVRRAKHPPCLPPPGVPHRPLRRVPNRPLGHRGHRGRADPRRPGRALAVRAVPGAAQPCRMTQPNPKEPTCPAHPCTSPAWPSASPPPARPRGSGRWTGRTCSPPQALPCRPRTRPGA
jgi:hypothetical protein